MQHKHYFLPNRQALAQKKLLVCLTNEKSTRQFAQAFLNSCFPLFGGTRSAS